MSLWENDIKIPSFDPLFQDKTCDVLIIGGGITGLNLYYTLQKNFDVCLVEARTLGMSVTKNTTAKLNYLQDNTLGYFIQKKKWNQASLYLKSQREGIQYILDIIKKEKISCDLEQVSSYLVTKQKKYVNQLLKIETFLKKENIFVQEGIPTNDFLTGIYVLDTYVFHPLKYLSGLVQSISKPHIYEHTRIMKIKKKDGYYLCKTQNGYKICAKKVIVCSHYPFFLFPYFLPIRSSIEKSYLTSKKVSKNLKYTYITMESPSLSSRFYETKKQIYQIFLGKSHKTFVKQNDKQNFKDVWKTFQVDEASISWSNVDILTFDHLPLVGKVKPYFYLASGFQTWGMAQSAVSALVIRDLLAEKENQYANLFSPKRHILKQYMFIPYFLLINLFSFIRSKYVKKNYYSASVVFFWKGGKRLACVTDKKGQEHIVHPVCPHMKCGLIFNEVEETWDCPCHSSRFSLDGEVLKGPSNYSIGIRYK